MVPEGAELMEEMWTVPLVRARAALPVPHLGQLSLVPNTILRLLTQASLGHLQSAGRSIVPG
jgi:hypothetical protein